MTLGPRDLSDHALRRLLALAAYYRANPVEAFVPSPALAGFMADASPRILVRAANRVGKSMHAAAKLVKIMLATKNGKYRAVGVSYKQSITVISKLLAQFIPADALAPGCVYTETLGWSHNLIRLRNGTTCQIKSSDQAAIAHAGDDLDGVWVDEIPPEPIWLECVKRVMSRGGWVWATLTPIGRPSGWFRSVVEAIGSPWVQHIVEFNAANCPWYSPERVAAWLVEASTSPWAYRQTIFGDWEGEVLDRTFTGFAPDNIVDDADLPNDGYRIGIGIDHGEGVGRQVAILCVWNATTLWVVDEVVNTSNTLPEADARAILARLEGWGWGIGDVHKLVGDINSAGKMGAGLSVNAVLSDALATAAGYRAKRVQIDTPNKGRGSVQFGEKLINGAFMRGSLRIHRNCAGLIHSLKNYSEGAEDLKHPLDALRYIAQPVLEQWSRNLPEPSRLRVR